MGLVCHLFVVSSLILLTSGNVGMLGAPRILQLNNATLEKFGHELAKVAHKFNSEYGNSSLHVITKLVNVTSQVVQGIFYTLFVKFSPTSCTTANNIHVLDTSFPSRDSCDLTDGESKICKVTLWDRPWLQSDFSKIIRIVRCSNDTS
ncbi:unnamed protein product [Schistosoma rodhaini]|uniref:Cystatin domain-containing protein n=1 Tax=Schistosoma rodhaini TaxID=6188 RepID=A0A183QPG4_9TREM|nr:unnamed protein product [Schistosoma rodhaini]